MSSQLAIVRESTKAIRKSNPTTGWQLRQGDEVVVTPDFHLIGSNLYRVILINGIEYCVGDHKLRKL